MHVGQIVKYLNFRAKNDLLIFLPNLAKWVIVLQKSYKNEIMTFWLFLT